MNLIGQEAATGFNVWSVIVATLGAVILLAIYRMVVGGGTGTSRR
jgi:uncharacterized membrane protein YeaQ/YmgE (transglycosylase-associated protein family)